MGEVTSPSPETITAEEFRDALSRYDELIERTSNSKATKEGQRTLGELDDFRYSDAPSLFNIHNPKRPMVSADVKDLVEWKLRHGKFRPTLMKLVSSNEPSFVEETIEEARQVYKQDSDVGQTLDILTKLKGIGPATASLLLAVQDPDKVIFFGDEAYYWLCCDGKTTPIKYNAKEYRTLSDRSQELSKRLGVKAIDIERVAYALLRGEVNVLARDRSGPTDHTEKKPDAKSRDDHPAKRKQQKQVTDKVSRSPARRSKRVKHA